MPRFYKYDEVVSQYKLRTIPSQIWRRLPLLKRIPYFIGSTIKLICKMKLIDKDIKDKENWNRVQIFECLPGRDDHYFLPD